MKKQIGPIRIATWRQKWQQGTRGFALSWNTSRLLLNLEFHYERRSA